MAREINVSFDISVPEDIDDKQIEEFLRFEIGLSNQISRDNPLEYAEISTFNPRFLIIKQFGRTP